MTDNTTTKIRRTNGKTTIYKTLHRKLTNPTKNVCELGYSGGLSVPVPHVTPVFLLLDDTNIILY